MRAEAVAVEPADVVVQWNGYAIDALANPSTAPVPGAGQTPPVSALHLAMVQGAVYDAVNSIDRGHEPYLSGLPSTSASASRRRSRAWRPIASCAGSASATARCRRSA